MIGIKKKQPINNNYFLLLFIIPVILILHFETAQAGSPTVVVHNFTNDSGVTCFNHCAEQFSGLPVGHQIISIGYWKTNNLGTNNQQMYLYKDDGLNNHIKFTGLNQVCCGFSNLGTHTIYFLKVTNLVPFEPITKIEEVLNTNGGGQASVMGIYTDNSTHTGPSTLIYQGVPQQSLSAGTVDFTINGTKATVPLSGTVWLAVYAQGTSLTWFGNTPPTGNASVFFQSPSDICSGLGSGCVLPTSIDQHLKVGLFNPRVGIYSSDGGITGYPGTLLQSSSLSSDNTLGRRNFTMNEAVPLSGRIWVGFASDDSSGSTRFNGNSYPSIQNLAPPNLMVFDNNTNLAPRNPFGFVFNDSFAMWMQLTYGPAGITIKPSSGLAATLVTVNGSGFSTTGTVTLKFDGVPLATSPSPIVPDHLGQFNGTQFSVPNTTLGIHIVNASDNAGNWAIADFNFTFNSVANIQLNPPSGPSYTNVQITGTGFHSVSNISFTFDGTAIAVTPTIPQTTATGTFSNVLLNVPASSPGGHIIKACDSLGTCFQAIFTLTGAKITNFAAGSQTGNVTLITPTITTDTPLLALNQTLYFQNKTLVESITYPAPIPINTLNSQFALEQFAYLIDESETFYENVTLTDAFNQYKTKSQSLSFEPVITTGPNGTFTQPNLTPGNQNFTQSNTNTIPIMYTRITKSPTITYLLVSYPNTYNMTCNLAYQFAQENKTYTHLPHTTLPNNRFQSNFTFTNPNNEIITTNCTDVNTHNSALYILVQSNFPLQQQIQEFRSGDFGTHGQFGVIDIISLIGVMVAMIGLSRVNEAAGIVIGVIMLSMLAFFQIITWPTLLTGIIATIVMIAIVSTKKLPWSQ